MDHATVLAYPALVERVAIDLAVQHTSVLLDVRCEIVRMRHLGPGHLQQLVAFVTEDIAELLVHFDDALGYGRDRHADQAELEIAPESLFAHAQDFLGALPLDRIRGIARVEIGEPQLVLERAVRPHEVGRDHTD
jgi:hypothetical protein